jgi:hypothetical protein
VIDGSRPDQLFRRKQFDILGVADAAQHIERFSFIESVEENIARILMKSPYSPGTEYILHRLSGTVPPM